jgi:hypothetical protein
MSRVIVHRSLPPLKKTLAHFSSFPKGKSHQQAMIDELRGAAKKSRTANPQPFYSMREVAQFFRVPLGTISPVYKALEREGIIDRIRSSRTILLGNRILPREMIRGVVGIPILMHSVMMLEYTRTLAMELQVHLRHWGYVGDIIFHASKEEEAEPDFATRLLSHRLDAVVLHTPLEDSRQNILSLRERGVRVLVIQGASARRDLPAVTYLLDCEPAYQEMAAKWRQEGIRKVWIWPPTEYLGYKNEADILKAIFLEHGLEAKLVLDKPSEMLNRVRRQSSKSSTVVAFLDATGSEEICNGEPQIIEKISLISRLAFCLGSIRVPYFRNRKIHADTVTFSATEIASRLADDICRLSVLPDGIHHTFNAHYQEQAPF